MKRFRTDGILVTFLAAAVLVWAVGCSEDEHRLLKELSEVERALSLLRNSPEDERGIRLEQLMAVEVQSPQVERLRDICAESHRKMTSAMRALDDARQKTANVESAVQEAKKAMSAENRPITAQEMQQLQEMSKNAAEMLSRVTSDLDRAEELVESCGREREELRRALTGEP